MHPFGSASRRHVGGSALSRRRAAVRLQFVEVLLLRLRRAVAGGGVVEDEARAVLAEGGPRAGRGRAACVGYDGVLVRLGELFMGHVSARRRLGLFFLLFGLFGCRFFLLIRGARGLHLGPCVVEFFGALLVVTLDVLGRRYAAIACLRAAAEAGHAGALFILRDRDSGDGRRHSGVVRPLGVRLVAMYSRVRSARAHPHAGRRVWLCQRSTDLFRLPLGWVSALADEPPLLEARRRLLKRVRQLVAEEATASGRVWGKLILPDYDVAAYRVCERVDAACQCRRTLVCVYAHVAEVVSEARLEEGACGGGERLAGGSHRLFDDRRSVSDGVGACVTLFAL